MLSVESLDQLSGSEFAARIDSFFKEDHVLRYGNFVQQTHTVSATAILQSDTLSKREEREQKRLLYLFYRARFQSAACLQYAANSNTLTDKCWSHANIQIHHAAMRQAMVVSSRIAIECLMEFIYCIEEGKLIPKKSKSKMNDFRKWCCTPGNRFGWLVFYLLVAKRFDVKHRSKEVHGTSSIATDALLCKPWPQEDSELRAINLMSNIWGSVLQTLNNEPVTHLHSQPLIDEDIFQDFFKWREIDLDGYWKKHETD